MEQRFVGKRVLLTGTGSGIGKATAKRFAAEGASVVCLDIKGHDETAAEIVASGATAIADRCDVSDSADVERAVNAAAEHLGGLDVACNIAGIGHFAHSHEEDPKAFDKIVAVNLNGTFYVCRYALPYLLESGGVIVNTASNSGLIGQPWSAAYCGSKGGVVNLTRAFAYEYRAKGVRVVAVAPGGTNTAIQGSFSNFPEGGTFKDIAKIMSPIQMAEPEEIAAAFAYIASPEARFITGSILSIDGGLTC